MLWWGKRNEVIENLEARIFRLEQQLSLVEEDVESGDGTVDHLSLMLKENEKRALAASLTAESAKSDSHASTQRLFDVEEKIKSLEWAVTQPRPPHAPSVKKPRKIPVASDAPKTVSIQPLVVKKSTSSKKKVK